MKKQLITQRRIYQSVMDRLSDTNPFLHSYMESARLIASDDPSIINLYFPSIMGDQSEMVVNKRNINEINQWLQALEPSGYRVRFLLELQPKV